MRGDPVETFYRQHTARIGQRQEEMRRLHEEPDPTVNPGSTKALDQASFKFSNTQDELAALLGVR